MRVSTRSGPNQTFPSLILRQLPISKFLPLQRFGLFTRAARRTMFHPARRPYRSLLFAMASGLWVGTSGTTPKPMHESQGCRSTPRSLQCRSAQRSAQNERGFCSRLAAVVTKTVFKDRRAHAGWGKEYNCYAPPDLDSCAHRLTELHPFAYAICALVGCSLEWRCGCPMYVAVVADISMSMSTERTALQSVLYPNTHSNGTYKRDSQITCVEPCGVIS